MNKKGYFGQFGGQFVSELLYPVLTELDKGFESFRKDKKILANYHELLCDFAGRPTPLYLARNLSKEIGCKVYLKREDLVHGGSHKLNNALGQALLAKHMGKERIITETAAGMHGVATMMAANVVGIKTEVYMGTKDIERQSINADRIRLLGGRVKPVERGSGVLKDAVSEALVDLIGNYKNTYYLVGSAVGPHPYPTIVEYFQSIIGRETRKQILAGEGKLPKTIIACGSGGSNALGIFLPFVKDTGVELVFVEGAGVGGFSEGSIGIFQGAKTYLKQDEFGMDRRTKSRSAGLNYPGRGPQMSYLYDQGRIKVASGTDEEIIEVYKKVSQMEGLIPAFETCHALVELFKRKGKYNKTDVVIVNFSGRGDKDMKGVL